MATKAGNQVKFIVVTPPAIKQALDKEFGRSGQKVTEIVRRAITAELAKRGVAIGGSSK